MSKFSFLIACMLVSVYANDPFEIVALPDPLADNTMYHFDVIYKLPLDDDHDYSCQINGETDVAGQSVDISPQQFSFNALDQNKVAFTLKVEADEDCRDNKLWLTIECRIIRKLAPFDEMIVIHPFHFGIRDTTPASMCQDPHIVQSITGKNENNAQMETRLCYDIFGKSGDILEFIGDENLGVTVHFQLRDDFYISKVFVKSILGMLTISTGKIDGLGGVNWSWEEKKDITLNKRLFIQRISLRKDSIVVESKNGETVLSVKIARVPVEYKQGYLNIHIEDIGNNNNLLRKEHTGILGYIGNKEYIFVNPIQVDSKVSTVVVNNRLVRAEKKSERSCYSVKLEDILYPRTMDNFKTLNL